MENLQFVLDAQDLTQERSINLVLEEVIEPRNLPQALRSIGRNAQMIWGIPDRIVLTPETAQHLLVYSFRNRIPLSGLSKNWVMQSTIVSTLALISQNQSFWDLTAKSRINSEMQQSLNQIFNE